jgi:peptidoglycan hydrolase FlgJ
MNVSKAPCDVGSPNLSLERVASDPKLSESDKIAEASRQFEAILLRQILAAAQKPAFPSRFNSQSFSSGVYQDMTINQLADQMSRSGGFGLAEQLNAQLTQQIHSPPAPLGEVQPPASCAGRLTSRAAQDKREL